MAIDPRFPGPSRSLPDEQPEPEAAGFFEAFGSNFLKESPVYNAWQYLSQDPFAFDPEYDNAAQVKADGLWDRRDVFAHARSKAHYEFLKGKLAVEDKARQDYAQSWGGLIGAISSNIVDPSIFVPLVGPSAKGLTALKQATLIAAGTAALQEVPLQLNQVDRTMEETATSVLGAAIIGGVLGWLSSSLSPREYARLGRDMGIAPRGSPIPRLGADDVERKLMPVNTPFTVAKEFDINATHPFIGAEAPDSKIAHEITPKNAYVVSPDSMDLLDIKADDALDTIIAKAKENDADALIFEGFDDMRAMLGETAGRLNRTLRELQDGIIVLDKSILRETARDGAIVHPRFGNGLVDHPITRDIETGVPSSAGSAVSFTPTSGTKKNWATKAFDPAADRISPVNYLINQPDAPGGRVLLTGRWMQQQMSVGGQRMQENVVLPDGTGGTAVASGGTIDHLKATHYGEYYKAQKVYKEAWREYIFSSPDKKIGGLMRANVAAKQQGKMDSKQFAIEVGRAMVHNNVHPTLDNPHVNKAAAAYSKLQATMFEDAKDVGIYDKSTEVVGDASFLNRITLPRAVKQEYNRLVDVLTNHYVERVLKPEFNKSLENMLGKKAAQEQFEKDVALQSAEALALRQQFLNELKDAELAKSEKVMTLEDVLVIHKERLADYREQAKNFKLTDLPIEEQLKTAGKKPFEKEIEKLKEIIKTTEEKLLATPDPFREIRASHKKRLRNLNKNRAVVSAKMADKLALLDRLEEQSLTTLGTMARRVRKILDTYDTLSDDVLQERISELKTDFAKLGAKYDKGEEKLTKVATPEEIGRQEGRASKLSDIAEQLADTEGFDRKGWKSLVELAEREVLAKANDLNGRRALRAQRLEDEISKMTQPEIEKAIQKQRGKYRTALEKFDERWGKKTSHTARAALEGDVPNFREFARQRATEVADAFGRMTTRLPVHDLVIGKHGVENARLLTIPREEIEFVLENDAETLMRVYMRTLAPDIELARRFGDVNASQYFDKLNEERLAQLELLKKEKTKDGKALSVKEQKAISEQINNNYVKVEKTLRAQIARLRHLWGIPQNPEGFAFRAGTFAMNLNVLRYMGMVTISSVADPGKIIMRNGLLNTFRDVFIPLLTNFKEFKASAEEGYLGGEILDLILHTRSNAMHDVMDDTHFGTAAERGMNAITSRMGQIAGFDYWNVAVKQLTSVGTTAHLMRAMQAVAEGGVSAKETAKYMEYLASVQLDAPQVERIWKQVREVGGGEKVRGLWYPNTEKWTDTEAKRAFRAALSGEITNTIITPGLEIPLTMNSNIGWRMAMQFRSFSFASVTKTLMAGLQQSDMAVVNGSLISLALGAFSYYLWAAAVGGKAWEEATNWSNPERLMRKYADEAIDRSGLLAVGSDLQEIAQRLPWVGPYSNFSGQYTTKRANMNILELFTGPTYDLLSKGNFALVNAEKPTEASIHALRQMVPFQNHLALRRAFDKIEKATGRALGVPARRNK